MVFAQQNGKKGGDRQKGGLGCVKPRGKLGGFNSEPGATRFKEGVNLKGKKGRPIAKYSIQGSMTKKGSKKLGWGKI